MRITHHEDRDVHITAVNRRSVCTPQRQVCTPQPCLHATATGSWTSVFRHGCSRLSTRRDTSISCRRPMRIRFESSRAAPARTATGILRPLQPLQERLQETHFVITVSRT
jgi:hypothetical protein